MLKYLLTLQMHKYICPYDAGQNTTTSLVYFIFTLFNILYLKIWKDQNESNTTVLLLMSKDITNI